MLEFGPQGGRQRQLERSRDADAGASSFLGPSKNLSYLDVVKAALLGPEAVSQASIRLALHRLGVRRGDGVILVASDREDEGSLAHGLQSRQLGFARLVGSWEQPAAGSERYLLVRADRALVERPLRRFGRPPILVWRVGDEATLVPPVGGDVLIPRVDPEELACLIEGAKGVGNFHFLLTPSSFIDGILADQFERSTRREGWEPAR